MHDELSAFKPYGPKQERIGRMYVQIGHTGEWTETLAAICIDFFVASHPLMRGIAYRKRRWPQDPVAFHARNKGETVKYFVKQF